MTQTVLQLEKIMYVQYCKDDSSKILKLKYQGLELIYVNDLGEP
jgi:hypothetical protein